MTTNRTEIHLMASSARLLEIQCLLGLYHAENANREMLGHSQAYGPEQFFDLAERARAETVSIEGLLGNLE